MFSRSNSGFDNAKLYAKIKNRIGVEKKDYDWNKVPNSSRPARPDDLRQMGDIMTRHIYACGTIVDTFKKRVEVPGEPLYGELIGYIQTCINYLDAPVTVAVPQK